MIPYIKHVIAFILCLMPHTLLAHPASRIETVKSMGELEQYIDQDTVVLFDLDHTLFEGERYGYGHANWFYDEIKKGLKKGLNEKEITFKMFPHWLVSQLDESVHVKPVEEITPSLIKKLQNNKIMIIGLTARQVPLVDISLKQLREININFKNNGLPDTIIHNFFAATMMKDGVIFSSDYNDKGAVLKAYLEKHQVSPKKIVFVDDSERHLHAVTKSYSDIEVIGLHYPLVAENSKNKWDSQLARDAYCHVAKSRPDLSDYALDCDVT